MGQKLLLLAACYYNAIYYCEWICGPGSSVGIATGYGLDGPGIESRWGARLFAHVQTGPEVHPAFYPRVFLGGIAAGARC
jgi:hypothetical protein